MKNVSFSAPCAAAGLSAFFIFFLNFNALYNYGSGYDTPILLTNCCVFLVWLVGGRFAAKTRLSPSGFIVCMLLFFCCTLVFCKNIFDGVFGILNVASALTESSLGVDSLYHSSLVESLVNYHLPSILVDGTPIRNYHYFSHILLALLSKITGVPAFFVYSYLYPQIAISVFMYLYVQLMLSIGKYFSCTPLSSLLTGIFLLLVEALLIQPGVYIISQSYFTSLILCLLYFNIFAHFNWFTKLGRARSLVAFTLTTLCFIFFISLSKISTGFFFWLGLSWFMFRQSTPIGKKLFQQILLLLPFLLALTLCHDTSTGVSHLRFHSVPQYFINYLRIHGSLQPIPIILVILLRFQKFLSRNSLKDLLRTQRTAIEESMLICFLACFVLAFLLIHPNDYLFFLDALSFFGMLALYYTIAEFYLPAIKFSLNLRYGVIIIFGCVLSCFLARAFFEDLKVLSNTYSNVKYQRSVQAGTEDIPGLFSFKKYFSESRLFKSRVYAILQAIREISAGHRNLYGIYSSEDISLKFSDIRAETFYYQGLTGVVRYTPIYKTKDGVFVTSGQRISKDTKFPYYGFNKLTIPPATSLDLAMEKAKKDGKKYLFYITKDNLYLIDLETKSSELIALPSS